MFQLREEVKKTDIQDWCFIL